MEVLLAGVFGFFALHTVFWFYRSLRVRLARGKAPIDRDRHEGGH
jgi:hypothetical protein